MRIVLKPWFAVVVLLAAISVWALTVAPWGPLHERTAVSSRLEVRGDTYRRQTVHLAALLSQRRSVDDQDLGHAVHERLLRKRCSHRERQLAAHPHQDP